MCPWYDAAADYSDFSQKQVCLNFNYEYNKLVKVETMALEIFPIAINLTKGIINGVKMKVFID